MFRNWEQLTGSRVLPRIPGLEWGTWRSRQSRRIHRQGFIKLSWDRVEQKALGVELRTTLNLDIGHVGCWIFDSETCARWANHNQQLDMGKVFGFWRFAGLPQQCTVRALWPPLGPVLRTFKPHWWNEKPGNALAWQSHRHRAMTEPGPASSSPRPCYSWRFAGWRPESCSAQVQFFKTEYLVIEGHVAQA